jgi:formate dehydrogenase subunit delta
VSEAPAALIRMANQIAANFSNLSDDQAAAQVADHLALFWAPPMRTDLIAYVDAGGPGLEPVVVSAVDQLRTAQP